MLSKSTKCQFLHSIVKKKYAILHSSHHFFMPNDWVFACQEQEMYLVCVCTELDTVNVASLLWTSKCHQRANESIHEQATIEMYYFFFTTILPCSKCSLSIAVHNTQLSKMPFLFITMYLVFWWVFSVSSNWSEHVLWKHAKSVCSLGDLVGTQQKVIWWMFSSGRITHAWKHAIPSPQIPLHVILIFVFWSIKVNLTHLQTAVQRDLCLTKAHLWRQRHNMDG